MTQLASEGAATMVRPELRALKAYHLEQSTCRFKLDQNEVPWDLPRRLKRRATEKLLARDWARYPDFHSDELRRRLGEHHGWPAEGILVGNGSNELLALTIEALVPHGGEVLGMTPCFGLYEVFVRRAGAVTAFVPAAEDLRMPVQAIEAALRRRPATATLLCSPNNPTGEALEIAAVERLLAVATGPLLLDNAYAEFCRWDYRPLLRRHPNLILFRTFSKAWSLGGLRLGYMLADPDLVRELIKAKLPYNVGHATAIAGEVALAERAVAERRIRLLVARREQWVAALAAAGLEVFPSQANFLLARVAAGWAGGVDVATLRARLAERGLLVRDVSSYPGLAECFRVSVGSGPALRAMIVALKEIRHG